MMPARWIAVALVAAGVLVVLAGLVDDLVRAAIWELLAAVGLLVWYGGHAEGWNRTRRRRSTTARIL